MASRGAAEAGTLRIIRTAWSARISCRTVSGERPQHSAPSSCYGLPRSGRCRWRSRSSSYDVGRSDWGPVFDALTVGTFPMIVVYVFVQRWFVRGLTAGVVKG